MEDMNFQAFLHAQGMSNTYPPQTFFQPAPQRRSTAQTNLFVPYTPHQHRGMMASIGAQPSFFADEMYHYRDEHALYEEMAHRSLVGQPAASNFAFRPLLPTAPAPMLSTTAPPAFTRKLENMAPLVIPGVLDSHVDQSQYSPVFDDDWHRLSFDFDAPSPESVDTQMTSPLTPDTEGNGSFCEHFYNRNQYSDNTIGAIFIKTEQLADDTLAATFSAKQHDVNFFAPTMYPAAVPNYFQGPRQHAPVYYSPPIFAPSYHNGFVMPAAIPLHSDDMEHAHPHHMPFGEATPAFHYQPNDFDDEDLREIEQTSEADDTPALSDAEDYQPVRSAGTGASAGSAVGSLQEQMDRDDFLLSMRRRGVSYREIKRRGRYREAESTLRGRYRMLTKDPSERVRKPEWTSHDVVLLRRAVAHFSRDQHLEGRARVSVRKIPWKKISTWIKVNGGTYLFAPATCASKWDALNP
ncbi:hypothetical protein LTR08_003826 [Meristemomyces frigidus]|nr:hypothetical protein LTR08_003826 [Meristemomyces frigidus]